MAELFSKPQLKARGWKVSMIQKFLPTHDAVRENPRYRSAPNMLLYLAARVEQIEKRPDFVASKEASVKRKASAKAAAATKRKMPLDWIEALPRVPALPERTATTCLSRPQAITTVFGPRARSTTRWPAFTTIRDFLDRIMVNYVRHTLTDYERMLLGLKGRPGQFEARDMIDEKIFEAITQAYPFMERECDRQLFERQGRRYSI